MSNSKLYVLDTWVDKMLMINTKQLDSDRTLLFQLKADGTVINLTGKTVRYYAEKPDKNVIFNDCTTLDAVNGKIACKLTEQTLAANGLVKLELAVIGETGKETTFTIYLVVAATIINDSALVSSSEFGAFVNALSQVQNIDNRFSSVNAQMAEKASQVALNATNTEVALKANKNEVANGLKAKGASLYANLPTSGNAIGDYYYCSDGDGTNPAGNYVWNGTTWYFGGTGDEGYNIVKNELTKYDNVLKINLYNPTMASTTVNGVTITKNVDGTYSLSGTATEQFTVSLGNYHFTPDTFILSGCPKLSGNARLYFVDGVYDIGYGALYGVGGVVDLPLYFWVQSGTNCNGYVIKPMLEKGTIAHDYTPYNKPFNAVKRGDDLQTQINQNNSFRTVVKKKFDFNGQKAIFFGDSITNGYTNLGGSGTVLTNNYVKTFSDTVTLSGYTNRGANGQAYSIGVPFQNTIANDLPIFNNYQYLFLAGGVNDWANGVSLDSFRLAVSKCFKYISDNFNGDVIIVSPINYSSTTYSGGDSHIANLNEYRQILFEEAMKYDFSFVDTSDFGFPSTIAMGDFTTEIWRCLLSDGVHPTETGYYLYGKKLANVLTGLPVLDDERLYNKAVFTGKYTSDGKPIWRYIFTSSLNSPTAQIDLTILDNFASEVIKADGYVTVGGNKYPLGFTNSALHLATYYNMALISFDASVNFVGGNLVIEVLYKRIF